MKLLFGVQATGNGHITRARALNKWFKHFSIEVDFIFSGRDKDQFWDMDEFGDYRCFRGLTFYHKAGKLQLLKTVKESAFRQLYKDICSLDLSSYDLVITDFEPITAWAAKKQQRPCIGIGHQYAFEHDVPRRGDDMIGRVIMRNYAPVSMGMGLHWHHFDAPILPPIAEVHETNNIVDPKKIVVYLGFEDSEEVIRLLEPFEDHLFAYYAPFTSAESRGHIQLKPLSREGFKEDLASAGGVICNAGFELSSEAIQLGKKLLIKPLKGQIEQLSNAQALEVLGLGTTMNSLDANIVEKWLTQGKGKKVSYPDVAKAIVEWLNEGNWDDIQKRNQMIKDLWQETHAADIPSFTKQPYPNI